MAEFNPDKLSARLEQLNREQLATMEKLVEDLLREAEEGRLGSKRADDGGAASEPPPKTASGSS